MPFQKFNNDSDTGDWSGFDSDVVTPGKVESKQSVKRAFGLWIHPFTRLHKIPVFRKIWLYLVAMGIYCFLTSFFIDTNSSSKILKEVGNAAYLGVIFGLLLVFRTNSAYERWWEGRRQWGILVNDTRNLAMKLKAYSTAPLKEKKKLGELMVSFAYALKHHLRDTRPNKDLPGLEPNVNIPADTHLPVHIANKMVKILYGWNQQGYLSEIKLLILDGHFNVFMDVCGACERIKATPLAVSYRAFLRQGILLNLIIFPWILIPLLGDFAGSVISLVASYFLIGLELIAEDIEEPFGDEGDDLPLHTICNNIQKSVSAILSVSDHKQRFTTSVRLPELDPLRYTTNYNVDKKDPLKEVDD